MGSTQRAHEIPLAELRSPICREFYLYWDGKRSGAQPPLRRDLDPPIDKPHLAQNLAIYDVVDGGRDFRCRLVGAKIVGIYAEAVAGRLLSDFWTKEEIALVLPMLQRSVMMAEPVAAAGSYYYRGRDYVDWTWIALPLRLDRPEVGRLIFCVDYAPMGPGPVKYFP
jgi:hypothetical protein